jgi:outer membrane protein OmpA-like peptidoglycan-associated protein
MLRHSLTRGAVTAALLVCSVASAQSSTELPGFDLERLDTNVGRGTALVGSGELLVPGGFSINLSGHYQRRPLRLSDGVQQLELVGHRATGLLAASYGVLSWLEVSAQVPYVLWQQGADARSIGLAPLTAQGLGTPVVQARLGFLSQELRQEPVDLSADLGVGLPFGAGTALAGDPGPRFHLRLNLGANMGWWRPALEAGVLFRPAIQLASGTSTPKPGAASEVRLAASASTTGQGLRGELNLRTVLTPAAGQSTLELLGGVRFPLLNGLDTFVLAGPGLGNAPGTPLFRVMAGVSFRQEPPPRIAFTDPLANRALQLTLNQPKARVEENRVRPTKSYEFVKVTQAGREAVASAKADAEREPLRPYQLRPGERLVVRGEIRFHQGSSKLSGQDAFLEDLVQKLRQNPNAVIYIEGHAFAEGSGADNLALSHARAYAVREYLTLQKNVSGVRVILRGLGEEAPVTTWDAERYRNHRAEVTVVAPVDAPAVTTEKSAP